MIWRSRVPARFRLRSPIWERPAFVRLWAATTVSTMGSAVTQLALPLTAVLTLNASVSTVGLLITAERAPILVVGLLAGAAADRISRRRILVAADLARCLLLASIPVAAVTDRLTVAQLFVVAFVSGMFTVAFRTAAFAMLPRIVEPELLVDANSKLGFSTSLSFTGGPALAGLLVQLVTAPYAIAVDAASYLWSAAFLRGTPRDDPDPSEVRPSMGSAIREGLGIVARTPLLRQIVSYSGAANFGWGMATAVFILYITRVLGYSPLVLGILVAVGGLGSILGSSLAGRMSRLGIGNAVFLASLLEAGSTLAIPAASGPDVVRVPILALAQLAQGMAILVTTISVITVRQRATPGHLLGRVIATEQFFSWSLLALGALVGGLLGAAVGIRTTLFVGGLAMLILPVIAYRPPLRRAEEHFLDRPSPPPEVARDSPLQDPV